MTDPVDISRRRRGALKGKTTRILQKINDELKDEAPDADILEELVNQLTSKEEAIRELNNDIISRLEEETDITNEVEAAEEYNERIITAKTRGQRAIRRRNGSTAASVNTVCEEPREGSEVTTRVHTVRLPKLEISKFGGDFCEWHNFWNQYRVAIHENNTITKCDKFTYLKSYLEGLAKKSISGLSTSDRNYDEAIRILQRRFGRVKLIIQNHKANLMKLPAVKRSNDLVALRALYDACEVEVRSLNGLGIDVKTFSGFLWTILFERIPNDVALEYTRRQALNNQENTEEEENQNLDTDEDMDGRQLMNFLRLEIESREMMHTLSRSATDNQETSYSRINNLRNGIKPKFPGHHNQGRVPTAANLTTGVEQRLSCIYCGDETHSTSSCQELSSKERSETIKDQNRCYVCLKLNHLAKNCRSRIRCRFCQRKHHFTICESEKWKKNNDYKKPESTKTSENGQEGDKREETSVSTHIAYPIEGHAKTVHLQTVRARLFGGRNLENSRYVRCLIDGGAQRTFVKETLSRSLELKIVGEEKVRVYAFASQAPVISTRRIVELQLQNTRHPNKKITIQALEIPHISSAPISVLENDLVEYLTSHGLQIADDSMETEEIEILLASDVVWRLTSGETHRITPELVSTETLFGWTVQGPTENASLLAIVNNVITLKAVTTSLEEKEISAQLTTFWDLDTMGIREEPQKPVTDDETMKYFEDTISKVGERYQVRLPWKENKDELKSNYYNAERRTLQLVKKFQVDKSLYNQYKEVIFYQLSEGIIEEVHTSEKIDNLKFYLPHQPVTGSERKTTKLRVVHDGSSSERNSSSLNECLATGPNLNPDLLDVILRFRSNPIAFVSDIEKAFLQIWIAPEDRDVLRFLWPNEDLGQELKILRIARVPFGITSSPFLLTATIRHHLRQYEEEMPDICKTLIDQLFVDDFPSGDSTVEKALKLSIAAKTIMNSAGMNLRKWMSNSTELEDEWRKRAKESPNKTPVVEERNPDEIQKVLGLGWKTSQDTIHLNVQQIKNISVGKEITKRHVLKTVSSVFDPVGFLSPFVIRVKILFQELWEAGIKWDEQLRPEIAKKFETWCQETEGLNTLAIPRHYFHGLTSEDLKYVTLHTFTDASEGAYAAVAYIRFVTQTGEIGVTFVASKSRVAPLKKLSLPRLELMGALLGARLAGYLKKTLRIQIHESKLWSDSMISLHWIKSTSRQWKPFVSNRVSEIQTLSEPMSWDYVKGTHNPADMPTRGRHAEDLLQNQTWWEGPSWLKLEESLWPKSRFDPPTTEELQLEKRNGKGEITLTNFVTTGKPPVIDLSRFSQYLKANRIVSWILRFLHNCQQPERKKQGPLSAEEIHLGKILLIRESQEHSYPDELQSLRNQRDVPKNSQIENLDPQLDENGLLFVKGRLENSEFTYREKHPWIISGKSRLAELVVAHHHGHNMGHSGLNETLASIREEFWITRARQTVKTIIGNCGKCKRFRVKAAQQTIAPLPSDRLNFGQPFTITGIDFGGPLYVRNGKKSTVKCYIALMTCANTRAIHLELVTDLSTEKFLMAFRRFISRRGVPEVIYSDNARTFKRAEQDLKDIFNNLKQPEVANFFSSKGISWKYIVEHAAWWGGYWRDLFNQPRKFYGK